MSSTYAHYQIPASLPSDNYAIISRYGPAVDDQDDDDNDESPTTGGPESPTARRKSFPAAYSGGRPLHPTIGVAPSTAAIVAQCNTETTPLLGVHESSPPIAYDSSPALNSHDTNASSSDETADFWSLFCLELPLLAKFSLPVFGTHLLEYTLVVASVVSIGHLSTNALAAITLGSMTASVTGFSVIQGFTSALDTMLPSAWTSDQPELVGLWSQRMGVVMAFCLVVSHLTCTSSRVRLGVDSRNTDHGSCSRCTRYGLMQKLF
jgi:MATE family multidrug resistance protein